MLGAGAGSGPAGTAERPAAIRSFSVWGSFLAGSLQWTTQWRLEAGRWGSGRPGDPSQGARLVQGRALGPGAANGGRERRRPGLAGHGGERKQQACSSHSGSGGRKRGWMGMVSRVSKHGRGAHPAGTSLRPPQPRRAPLTVPSMSKEQASAPRCCPCRSVPGQHVGAVVDWKSLTSSCRRPNWRG